MLTIRFPTPPSFDLTESIKLLRKSSMIPNEDKPKVQWMLMRMQLLDRMVEKTGNSSLANLAGPRLSCPRKCQRAYVEKAIQRRVVEVCAPAQRHHCQLTETKL